ncbi:MAG: M1 family metallopeptidase, partial [Planctomycetota bacterium]
MRFGAVILVLMMGASAAPVRAVEPPAWLPRYDLDIRIDTAKCLAVVKQRVTFINRHQRPASELVFNAHGRYTIPDDQIGFMAKMAEMLRIAPKEGFYFDGPPLVVQEIGVVEGETIIQPAAHGGKAKRRTCDYRYGDKNPCTIVVPLERPVGAGESVTVEIDFEFRIPKKMGRWSSWEEITALAQWLPTLAVYDHEGWHPQPFIPWHQPFYNEAGRYTARITLPPEQKLACPMPIRAQTVLEGENRIQYELEPAVLRDFSLTCSARYQLTECMAGKVKVRCLHLPEHAHYGKIFTETACQAIPIYERWFGPYPYAQFTIAEACFGWNGNECSAMVLIDERQFNMPHIARGYPVYLLQHELCHQWFYNIIGTNGYSETFMDEGLAVHFSHKLADLTIGKNNPIIEYPTGLGWLPNIHREDLRFSGMIASRARGELHPTVQPIEKFDHLAALLAYTYDRGGKIFGQIEARLGEEAMLDFMRGIYRKYAFQIFRVHDLQQELEAYTGRSWHEFFQHWVLTPGTCDWKIDRVEINGKSGPLVKYKRQAGPVQVTVNLLEQEGFPEPTVLGIQLTDEADCFNIRIPIDPTVPVTEYPECNARIESKRIEGHKGKAKYDVRVVFTAPVQPKQIVVDPDRVLIDSRPENNAWAPHIKWRPTPLYTILDEVDVTNSYDKWSVIFGPWIGTSTTTDPWYSRSPLFGAKIGVMRIQELTAGAFVGYRTNDRNIVAGVEALWSHVCLPQVYLGFNVERALTTIDDSPNASRAAAFARYVLTGGS